MTDTTAKLKGIVADPSEGTTTVSYWFEYGPTKSYGSETPHRSMQVSDLDAHPVSEDVTELDPGTTYHYRACAKQPIKVCAADREFTTSGGATELSITADPALYPDFKPNIKDYVLNCTGGPVEVGVEAPVDTEVAIDGGQFRNGTFTTEVALQPNQRFSFVRRTDAGQSTHHARCLPDDFPEWTFEKSGPADQEWYLTDANGFVIAFDGHGVPVWWFDQGSRDVKNLPDGTLSWGTGNGPTRRYVIRGLDGSLINSLQTVGTETDIHDFQALSNGNYLLMSYKPRVATVDLTAYGGPVDATVIDAEVQEVEPDGDLVWSWNSKDHVGLDETTQDWWEGRVLPQSANGYDIVHTNSAEITNDGSMLISLRHTNGVYKIDRTTGDVIWKLGGTTTPESLDVVDDPFGQDTFGGQHDARLHPDGTLTAFDNGATQERAPRGVRFRIDEASGTATYLESISGLPDYPEAICCGSARRLASGGWLVAWGNFPNTNGITETDPDGSRNFKLSFASDFSYRAHPVPAGQIARFSLRNGMDAQHPR